MTTRHHRTGWQAKTWIICSLLVVASACLLVPNASAADYTWSGSGGFGADAWSNGANWLGGVAPSPGETIGTLTLPQLPSFSEGHNDLSGLTLNQLQIDNSRGYGISGDGLTLGSGGLTLSAIEPPPIFGAFRVSAPLTLGASQTWTVSAPPPLPPVVSLPNVELAGVLSGEGADLTINLNTPTWLRFGALMEAINLDDELGNVTINGVDTAVPVGENETIFKSIVVLPTRFDASDGNRLTVNDVSVEGFSATGPITAIKSVVGLSGSAIGAITATASDIGLNGNVASVSSDAASSLNFGIDPSGNTPGTDYNQVTSAGAVTLGGASLSLGTQGAGPAGDACPPPSVGQVYTLITTTGSLSGQFGNAANGDTVESAPCIAVSHGEPRVGRVYRYRINYNLSGPTKTVTATALPAVPTLFEEPEPPTISGTAMQGQTLSLSHGNWSNEPTGYADQWQRCDTSGNNCQAIAGATAQTYTLTAADVGFTIQVQETASNAEGASTPAASTSTAVVQAAPSGGEVHNPGSSGTQSPGSPGLPPVSCCDGPATISSAQITALLARQLVLPSGKAAKIGSLLKSGGLTVMFKALEAGTLSVQWYEVPLGAKLASKAKPVLVAAGQATFTGAGSGKLRIRLTAQGKQLLRHAKRVKLEARGTFKSSGGVAVSTTKGFVLRR